MFAVIRTGGKQYRVAKDDKIVVEKLTGEPGAMVELADVLMIGGDGKAPTVGSPVIDKAAVFAEVVEQSRADKIIVFKKHRRKNYRRTRGHRQEQTVLRIVDVSPTGTRPKAGAKAKAAPKTDTKPKAEPKEKAAPPAETKKTEARAPAKEEAKKKPAAKKPAAPKAAAKKDAPKKKPAAKKKAPAKGKSKE
ncbi:MAG: 50S ribosomal protein L21 [Rhodospirillaceae bacterium]|jgi:large subunit ribosomal protein L21|nr:MAG: 50S ribosomal protein L21 [Rhodospirillaceae bacterium]PPR73094.1 MAG: 50S ribosomal protein L21 [Alphaproteobacteria bacterium MarineAlpha3_Bin2]